MKNPYSLKQFVSVFALTAVVVLVVRYSEVFEQLSYSIEKGRLRALSEHIPPDALLDQMQTPSRTVADLVTPAVVRIETTRVIELRDTATIRRLLDADPEFGARHPWLEDREGRLETDESTPAIESGLGSGFVYDADEGLIVTNHHVTDGADGIEVVLPDGRRFEAEVVGSDPQSDLAVLRVPATRLHEVRFGDSRTVAVGDDVFTLGNPFGLRGSFSRGIVSGLGRSDVAISDVTYQGFIQTDAVINPGNSGGPLVNVRGEVIGVNTAIATKTGTYSGVGFAIPSTRVVALLPQLVSGRPVVRGFLGVSVADVRLFRERAEALGWEEPDGVFIDPISEDSPAAMAGMRTDDIVVTINGEEVKATIDMMDAIAPLAPGTVVTLGYWRDGEFRTTQVELAERPDGR